MRCTISFFLLLLSWNLTAQKVKIDETTAYVDEEAYLHYERKNLANEASVHALGIETEQIFIIYRDYKDPAQITKSNPEGKVRWVEINFLEIDRRCEVQSITHKAIVKLLYENRIFENGVFNAENAERMARKYGMPFSESRPGSINIPIHE